MSVVVAYWDQQLADGNRVKNMSKSDLIEIITSACEEIKNLEAKIYTPPECPSCKAIGSFVEPKLSCSGCGELFDDYRL